MIWIDDGTDGHQATWHVGDPLPDWIFTARYLSVTMDGDELEMLQAMAKKPIMKLLAR